MAHNAKNSWAPVSTPPEVMDFLSKASALVAFDASETFDQRTWCEFTDLDIASPIEQVLYTALKAVRQIARFPEDDVITINGKDYPFGVGIYPQRTFGAYRVDFKISCYRWPCNGVQEIKTVLVECDSQQWHERTEQERRYEKRRDRNLTAQGYRLLHYTGKEILENPYLVASEILSVVDEKEKDDIYEIVNDCLANM